jgi:hypothetical protein
VLVHCLHAKVIRHTDGPNEIEAALLDAVLSIQAGLVDDSLRGKALVEFLVMGTNECALGGAFAGLP